MLKSVSTDRASKLLRKLVIGGLVQRWIVKSRPKGFHYRLTDVEPLGSPIRSVLASIAAVNGLALPAQAAEPRDALRVYVAPMKEQGDRRGIHFGPRSILGSPIRTLAIIIVAMLGEVDENTIARACAVTTDRAMLALLRPIQRDGIFVTKSVGRFKLCALPDAAWKPNLEALARTIVAVDPNAGALVEAARQIRIGGTWHNRRFLERYLRDGNVLYKDPGPETPGSRINRVD